MKILFFILGLILFIRCSKSEDTSSCNMVGTWQQVIHLPDEPDELYGAKMELLNDGSMKMLGITGLAWTVKNSNYLGSNRKLITGE